MHLDPVTVAHAEILYELLNERSRESSISHREMPSFEDHYTFVCGRPYFAWYMINVDGEYVGEVHMTRMNELAVHIFDKYSGNGYASMALEMLMDLHEPRSGKKSQRVEAYLANLNPQDMDGIDLYSSLGFDLCQVTMRKP